MAAKSVIRAREADQVNGQLMAASPDLFAALMRLLACPALNLDDMEKEDWDAIEQANDALGKASGLPL